MKKNIKKVKKQRTTWWTWDEYCDKCKKQIYKSGEKLSSEKPKDEDKEICFECCKELYFPWAKDAKELK